MGFLRLNQSSDTAFSSGVTGKQLIGMTMGNGMFKNLATGGSNLFTGTSGYAFPADINADGYPKNTASLGGQIARILKLPTFITSSTVMVLRWSGVATRAGGAIWIARGAPGFTIVSDPGGVVVGATATNLFVSGTNGRITFTFNGPVTDLPSGNISISFVGGSVFTNIANLILCRLSDEASLLAATTPEEMWVDEYVAVYDALNPKIIRPMGWTNPNDGCNVSQSRYLPKWQTSLDLCEVHWEPGAWAGLTSGTNAYTCASQPDATGSYVHNEMIQFMFVNASNDPGNLTLNSGGRGAKQLVNKYGNPQYSVNANQLMTVLYDAILNKFRMCDGDGQTQSVPFELQVGFANRINAHLWVTFPYDFDNASVTAITTVIRDRLNSNLTCYFEYCNEVWNNSPGYSQTYISRLRGPVLGFPADTDNSRSTFGWYALRAREIMGLVTAAWSPRTTSQLKRVLAFQAFGGQAATDQYRLQGQDLAMVANGGQGNAAYATYTGSGGVNYKTVGNRPIDYCDVLSYATYYHGAQLQNFDGNWRYFPANEYTGVITAADNYAAGGGGITSALNFVDNDIRAGTNATSGTPGSETMASLNSQIYSQWNTICAAYTGRTVECYEGGYEGWYPLEMETCLHINAFTSATVTFSTGHPSVNWASHGYSNGAWVVFATTGTLPPELHPYDYATTVDYYKYVVANATTNAFDLADLNGNIITLTGTGSGTHTGKATRYGGPNGRIGVMLAGYKNDARYQTIVTDQYVQFIAPSKSTTWAWLILPGPNQWAAFVGDEYTATYKNWDAMVAINHS
jgi:hypothetical protein